MTLTCSPDATRSMIAVAMVSCPKCHKPRGMKCRGKAGQLMRNRVHGERLDAMRRGFRGEVV